MSRLYTYHRNLFDYGQAVVTPISFLKLIHIDNKSKTRIVRSIILFPMLVAIKFRYRQLSCRHYSISFLNKAGPSGRAV